MADDAGVIDAEPLDSGIDVGSEVETTPETQDTTAETLSSEPIQPGTELVKFKFSLDGKTMALQYRTALERIKELPEGDKIARDLIQRGWQSEQFRREFPQGIKEARQLKQIIADLSGGDGLTGLQADLTEYRKLDEDFKTASPAFVDTMAKHNPEAFAKLMPMGMERLAKDSPVEFQQMIPGLISQYQKINPEGYASYFAGVMLNTLVNWDVSVATSILAQYIPETSPARTELAKIEDTLKTLKALSSKPLVKAQEKPPAEVQNIEQVRQQEELRHRKEVWDMKAVSLTEKVFDPILTNALKGRNVSEQNLAGIKELYSSASRRLTFALPGFKEKAQQYFNANDFQGYERHLKSSYESVAPRAAKEAIDRVLPSNGKRTTTTTQPAKQNGQPGPVTPPVGFKSVDKMPSAAEMNTEHPQAREMFRKKQAILKNGTRVQWK
jgi:hypothetical protein